MCKHVPFLKCIFNYIIITSIISLLDRDMYIVDDVLKTALLFCVILLFYCKILNICLSLMVSTVKYVLS